MRTSRSIQSVVGQYDNTPAGVTDNTVGDEVERRSALGNTNGPPTLTRNVNNAPLPSQLGHGGGCRRPPRLAEGRAANSNVADAG